MIKSRRFGRAVHVARMGEHDVSHKIVSWKNEGRNHLENLGYRVDGRKNLKLTFKVRCEGLGASEHGNGRSV